MGKVLRDESIPALDRAIEKFLEDYKGTWLESSVNYMYENGTRYETICDYLGWDYSVFTSKNE